MVIFNVIKRICLTVRLISVRVRDDVRVCVCVSMRALVNKSELYSHSHRINNHALHST